VTIELHEFNLLLHTYFHPQLFTLIHYMTDEGLREQPLSAAFFKFFFVFDPLVAHLELNDDFYVCHHSSTFRISAVFNFRKYQVHSESLCCCVIVLLQSDLVEEYFEAHSSSKVLTSDRTLQKLQTPKLDRETLLSLLDKNPPRFAEEIEQLNAKHEKNFNQWMLQLHMGFNILIYGLGSKKLLLEKFRTSMLSDFDHVVVNGFFPSMTLKSILNSLTCDVFGHEGTFRNPADQIDFIIRTLREDPSNHVFLIIHNIDGPMLRGDRTQQALGQLAALPNMHLLASIDHINAPLIWDQAKMSMFNWLWYETTTYLPYTEETSYENSLLVQQTGALALSSLTHVLRSLTPNARGIFRLLAEFQLENKDNPAYTGLSFQDFYQRCRESFLVNSDITLRTQLTEFRDHKLIRNKKGADGVEYLLIPVDNGTLTDFLEKNDVE
uniref:Origin recognition complex subunit 2 n=1 Tax=Cyprinus carpio TaxID=7962 RepID=A0A8C2BC41_CYPCA